LDGGGGSILGLVSKLVSKNTFVLDLFFLC
jgi:hypothetical protein